MTKERFTELLNSPQLLVESDMDSIAQLVSDYPFFGASRALLAAWHKKSHDLDYAKSLKNAASRTQDRLLLHHFLQKAIQPTETPQEKPEDETLPVSISKVEELPGEEEDIDFRSMGLLEKEILGHAVSSTIALEVDDIKEKPQEEKVDELDEKPDEPEEPAGIEEQEQVSIDSKRSFSGWLSAGQKDRGKTSAGTPSTEKRKKSREEERAEIGRLIDEFIQNDPQISSERKSLFKSDKLVKKSIEDQPTVVTETLAKIYERQDRYDKAIETYEALILNNPEKRSYFASLIRRAKEKQNEKK